MIALNAPILSDSYALRESRDKGSFIELVATSGKNFVFDYEVFDRCLKQLNGGAIQADHPPSDLKPKLIEQLFANFQHQVHQTSDQQISLDMVGAAVALLDRRVEQLCDASSRMLACAMAAYAMASWGLLAHIVTSDDDESEQAASLLVPIFHSLGLEVGLVKKDLDEVGRTTQYRKSIVVVSAREVAMDFLRDAVKWPQRGDSATRTVDRLLGRRAKSHENLLNGLHCALILESHHSLIDHARAPIVLTGDAHPMHETEEIQFVLEFVSSLVVGEDFVFVDQRHEIAYTPLAREKIAQLSQGRGGLWRSGLADTVIAVAIVVNHLVKEGTHYRIQNGRVQFVVDEALVPGAKIYSLSFIQRVLEIKLEQRINPLAEVVGRASYQQVFNRYHHLSGTSAAVINDRREYSQIYELKTAMTKELQASQALNEYALFCPDQASLLRSFNLVASRPKVLTNIVGADFDQYQLIFVEPNPTISLEGQQQTGFQQWLENAAIPEWNSSLKLTTNAWITLSSFASELDKGTFLNQQLVLIMIDPESNWFDQEVFWRSTSKATQSVHMISLVSGEHPVNANKTMAASLLARILKLQQQFRWPWRMLLQRELFASRSRIAKGDFAVRQNLLRYDRSMQSLLAYSGRGLYD